MRRLTTVLSDRDHASVTAAVAFLHDRLEERATIEWALQIGSSDAVKGAALREILDGPRGWRLPNPWQSAWRLIQDSWETPEEHRRGSDGHYRILERVRNGDRSGGLIAEIMDLVRLGVRVSSAQSRRKTGRPRLAVDLLSVWPTSGELIDPVKIGLDLIRESHFLKELAHGLDAEVHRGLDIATRLGWNLGHGLSRLGGMYRVYYVPVGNRRAGEHEPDEFHRGIAPLVKLLFAVVAALKEIDLAAATNFVRGWSFSRTPVHIRLWAASARDTRIVGHPEVGAFLRDCEHRQFWELQYYPEIAELRASRFSNLAEADRGAVLSRLRRMPPRSFWPRKVDPTRVKEIRLYWAARELRRIEIMGARLPRNQRVWLAGRLEVSSDLSRMSRVDEGFLGKPLAQYVQPNPDTQYDLLEGINRLGVLETALASPRRGWDDDPSGRAWDWIRADNHATRLLDDLESIPDAGAAYPRVWDHIGTAIAAPAQNGENNREEREAATDTLLRRSLALIEQLPDQTLRGAIEGITQLLATWERRVATIEASFRLWLRLWPIAITATNKQEPADAESELNVVAPETDDREPMDLDTLNTPVGRLMGVFLAACPRIGPDDRPFDVNSDLRGMRDAAVSATGRSDLIARHRMIEALPWFLVAAPDWSEDHLLAPLRTDTKEALALWRAVARQTLFTQVLRVIGGLVVERAADRRLGRQTRRGLVFSLVVESLHSFRERREPAVPNAGVQQMLRSLDDEVRAHAAGTLQRFVMDLSTQAEAPDLVPSLPEELFHLAVGPFLQQVWPQERSLTNQGIARAFADLPAACGAAFADAVSAIERFLMPFECWSMGDFGFHSADGGQSRFSQINNETKAEALLHLLDCTIGAAEHAVVPYDLGSALDQIQEVAFRLARTREFRRLAALTRR
jgi:hypothetical protein